MKNVNNNEELNTKTQKRGKRKLSSNPIEKVTLPIDGVKMISVPQTDSVVEIQPDKLKTTKKKLDKLIKPISTTDETSFNSIVETINNFNTSRTKPRNYNNEYTLNIPKNVSNANYFELLKEILNTFQSNKSMVEVFGKLSSIFISQLKWNFVGFGLFHEKSKCINLKLYSKTSNTYLSKIFLSDVIL